MAPRKPNKSQRGKPKPKSAFDVVKSAASGAAIEALGVTGAGKALSFGRPIVVRAAPLIGRTVSKLQPSILKARHMNTARNIGSYVAEATGEAATFVAKQGRTARIKGDVFTPQGVFKGKDVFVKKAPLTSKQISGVQQGMDTRAQNEFARQARIGAKGALYGGVAGAAGLYGVQKGVQTIKDNIENAKKLANKTKKVPKKK